MPYRSPPPNMSMVLTGDSLITRPVSMHTEPAFLKLVKLLRDSTVAITNAEMLFHNYEDSPTFIPGGTYMRARPDILDELKWMGINLLAAANNHSYDFGENGLRTNLENLERAGIVFAGIGRTMGEAREPRFLETEAGRVALISATSSGPPALFAGHQSRDGRGRPGANMIRHTAEYCVDRDTFSALQIMRDKFGLSEDVRPTSRKFRDHSWGIASQPDSETDFYLGDLQDEWLYPAPAGYRIRLADSFERNLVPNQLDIAENVQRIEDAKRMADWVIVSMHNHEQGHTADDPADPTVIFAHAAIDAGADVFHGHGPHRDRGIEIYKGKPIFYSIGHFFFENETIDRVPFDNAARQGLDPWTSTPADFFDSRSGREWMDEWSGYANDPNAWRDVVAVLQYDKRDLKSIELLPIELGFKSPRSRRGRPLMAAESDAQAVLNLFRRLSAPFGTKLQITDNTGVIDLANQ